MTLAILGKGTVVEYEDAATWYTLEEPTSIGNIGDVATFLDVTNLSSSAREYIANIADTEEKTITCRHLGDDGPNQERLKGLVGETVSFRITLPAQRNSSNQKRYSFDMALGGYQIEEPTADQAVNVIFSGRVSGTTTETQI
jgi:hypothetical protein